MNKPIHEIIAELEEAIEEMNGRVAPDRPNVTQDDIDEFDMETRMKIYCDETDKRIIERLDHAIVRLDTQRELIGDAIERMQALEKKQAQDEPKTFVDRVREAQSQGKPSVAPTAQDNLGTTYRIGQRFNIATGEYLLCQVAYGQVCMVNLKNGNRLKNPIDVKMLMEITRSEIDEMVNYDDVSRPWRLITQ